MNTKTLHLILLALFLSACGVNVTLSTNADKVVGASAKIADFDLPAGYHAKLSAQVMDYSVTAFNPGDGQAHLYLIQSDNQEDGQKLAGILEQIAPGSYDPQTLITVIETHPATVRGQQGMLAIREGRTSEGDSYRQAALALQGNGGPALLVFTAPVTSRDQDTWMHSSHLFTNKMSYP